MSFAEFLEEFLWEVAVLTLGYTFFHFLKGTPIESTQGAFLVLILYRLDMNNHERPKGNV